VLEKRLMNLATLPRDNLEKFGEYERLIFEGRTFTNRELYDASRRLATALARLELAPNDKVVVFAMNCPEVLISYPAIWSAGCVAIPVLALLDTNELSYILKNSEAKALITTPELYDRAKDAVRRSGGTVRHVIVIGGTEQLPDDALSFDRLVAESEPMAEPVDRDAADLAVILYTSGTTGNPKGVMQTHGNLFANAYNSYNSQLRKDLKLTSLLVLPLAHSFGLGVSIGGNLYGGKAILTRWFDPEESLKLIQEHKIQAMAGVPTMYIYMLNHPHADRYDTSTMERWLVGGAPMLHEQMKQFEKKFGGRVFVGYGLTESCPGISGDREELPSKPGSCGVPNSGVKVKIVDEEGNVLGPNQPGEICASGDNISPGYYKMPEATAETFKDGWLHTGDVGYLDDDGYLFIVERKKDLIIRGGFNVYPKDVEEVLAEHPAVQECAVVGVPDALMGEEVYAYIVRKHGADVSSAELIKHCQSRLAKYKTPKHVEFVDAMPKTNIGKIQKKELRKLAQTRASARPSG
jgi:long-chain acyl-CoA synthetase